MLVRMPSAACYAEKVDKEQASQSQMPLNLHGHGKLWMRYWEIISTHLELCPFEGSLQDVNKHRQEMDLEPIEDYMNTLKREYKAL